ncbi:MAG: MATE family efflux transporter [Clostridia bacterium]|nr:MATE family efflux transporter [Clostridia bacterium]
MPAVKSTPEQPLQTGEHPLSPRERQLAFDPILALVIRYSVPAIIGMLVNALYNVVDRFWIGQLHNTAALSGIGLTLPMFNFVLGFMQLVGVGATATISLKLGAKRHAEAEQVLANALTLCILIGSVIMAAGLIWLDPILVLLGGSPATVPYARDYLQIILLGNVFNTIGFALNHTIRGAGNPRRSASTQLLGATLNIVLDPLFILGFGWGVRGAAWATIISQFVSMVWVLSYFVGQGSYLRLKPSQMMLQARAVRQIVSIGVAPFTMQISMSLVTILANRMLKFHGGDAGIAVMTIVTSMTILFLMPLFGINQGIQPILGYNYGAKNYQRVESTWRVGVTMATGIVLLGFALVQLFPQAIIRLFSTDPVILDMGSQALRTYLMVLPFLGFQIISTIYFQSIGHARTAMFASLMRQVIFLVPLYLVLPHFLGISGVWLASPIADGLSVVVTAILIARELSRLRQLGSQQLPEPAAS